MKLVNVIDQISDSLIHLLALILIAPFYIWDAIRERMTMGIYLLLLILLTSAFWLLSIVLALIWSGAI